MQEVQELLNQAKAKFHELRGDKAAPRAEQFDAHMATVQMVVDHAADEVAKETDV